MDIKDFVKNKLEKLTNAELNNVNCPLLFGEVELPECLKDEMDNE